MRYRAAYYATVIGMVTWFFLGGGAGAVAAAAQAPTAAGAWENVIPELGAFGAVGAAIITVFKFMLGRQDARDAKADLREDAVVAALRADIESLRSELAEERRLHNDTRQKLIELLMRQQQNSATVRA